MTQASSTTRRQWLAQTLAIGATGWTGLARAQGAEPIRLGQSIALTGPLADLGLAIHHGAQACFAATNARGGVNGRPIELVARDDGYDVKRAVENIKGFVADPAMFGLFSCMGTPIVEAMLPLIKGSDMPCFTPMTGATSARPADMRNVFNVRSTYPEEAARLIQHLATIGHKRVAIAYQNNSFGKEIAQSTDAAIKQYKLVPVTTAAIENNGIGSREAAARIAASEPDAVLIGLAGKPTIDFVKAMRAQRRGVPLYTLSVFGAASILKALGDDAYGIAVSQVVPLPTQAVMPVVRDFHLAWQASGTKLEPSHLALEGYINARVLVEALKRVSGPLKRASFIESTWGLKRLDLGGYDINFEKPGRSASKFIELTLIGRAGKFIR
jgi:branched-chain amino acid transport system substrate-binding protein